MHSPFRWVFADSAARVAEAVTTSDTDKVAYQKSDTSIWVLRDNSPKTWISLSSGSKYTSGTDSAAVVGFSDKDSIYVEWTKVGNLVFMYFTNGFLGTESTGEFRINIPASMPPVGKFFDQSLPSSAFSDDGLTIASTVVLTTARSGSMITILYDGAAFGWPSSGTIGIATPVCIIYWTI